MSERKTTEIKLRVTPVEKAAWQLAAEDEGVGLSELIRREMNDWAAQRRPADGASEFISTNVRLAVGEFEPIAPKSVPVGTVTTNGLVEEGDIVRHVPTGEVIPVVPTSGDVDFVDDTAEAVARYGPLKSEKVVPKPWMFEARASD